jgi:HEAT repeat protein
MKHILGLIGIVLCAATARGDDVGELVKQLKNGDNTDRRTAAKALADGGAASKDAVPALKNALKDRDMFVRSFSAQALGEIGPGASSAVPALTAALNDARVEVQLSAAHALGKLGPSGIKTLIVVVRDDNRDRLTRRQAIDVLSNLGPTGHSAVPALTDLLKVKTGQGKKNAVPDDLRITAATGLGSLATPGDKDAIAALESLVDKQSKASRDLKRAANQALRKIRKSNK